MSSEYGNSSDRQQRLEQVLVAYLEAAESGHAPDQQEFIERHAEFADELAEFFAGGRQIDELAASIRAAVGSDDAGPVAPFDAPTTGVGTSSVEGAEIGARVRYFGDYELLEEIARGGMGVVYRARQVNLKRIVALKMILAGQLAGEQDVRRFHAEAEAAAELDHPNIVPIYEVGEHEGQHYFSMALVEGESLACKVAKGVLPAREAAELIEQVARAIAYAHEQGVIHRDLKPSNVLLDEEGRPRVTDFGLAKRIEGDGGLTATGQVLGTPGFMPPEQASGKHDRIKETADVYSLGAILYTLLTGRPPFQADNPLDTLLQVLEQEPVSPRLLNPKLPKDLETICLKCLEKEPHRRYAGADELADDLTRYLSDEPIRARPLGNVERVWRWARKQRRSVALTAGAALATAVLVVGGLLGWYAYQQWQLGYVTFSTTSLESPHLVAEVLDGQDRPVTGRFTVPTQQPMPLASDSYRLRVSASGRLSETFQFLVGRGRQDEYKLTLEDSQLWPTLQIARGYDLIDIEGRDDVIVFSETGISRLDGASCRELWSIDLTEADDPILQETPGFRGDWTSGSTSHSGAKFSRPPQLAKPAPDLDGDGIGDLVLAARHQAWLLAVSGNDGKLLWCAARGGDTQKEPDEARHGWGRKSSTTLGPPSVVDDLNGDGRPDLLATFAGLEMANGERANNGEPRRWIEAVSGATGKTLWSVDLDDRWFQLPAGAEVPSAFGWFANASGSHSGGSGGGGTAGGHHYRHGESSSGPSGISTYVPGMARVVRLDGKPSVVALAGTHLIAVDLLTGKPVWPARDLRLRALRPAQFADLDGDSEPELILVAPWKSAPSQTRSGTLSLGAWSLKTGKQLWEKKIAAGWAFYDLYFCPPQQWPVAADIDGDGLSELIVPNGTSAGGSGPSSRTAPWGTLEVLDGRTGTARWQRRLINMEQHVDRFTVGPDIDADGNREIFVATLCQMDAQAELFVDALSGKDGSSLWFASAELTDEEPYVGALRWWNAGADGYPQLLASIIADPSRTPQQVSPGLFVFSATTGQLNRIGRDLGTVRFGDGDGDGFVDLYTYRADDRRIGASGGKLSAVRGLPAEVWRSVGQQWTVAADFDSDGVTDLLSRPQSDWPQTRLAAVSGRSGDVLWNVAVDGMRSEAGSRAIEDDLDADGTPDVLLYDDESGRGGGSSLIWPLHAISGRTGKLLWAADAPGHMTGGSVVAESRDLDGDGRAEIVCVAEIDWGSPLQRNSFSSRDAQLWLAVFAGHSGKLLWRKPLGQPRAGGNNILDDLSFGQLAVAYADLDDDGILDLALPAEALPNGNRAELRAFSGADGKLLWKRALAPPINQEHVPLPVAADIDGDGKPEVVALDYVEKPASGNRTEIFARLIVLGGTDGAPKSQPWETKVDRSSIPYRHNNPEFLNRPVAVPLAGGPNEPAAIALGFWGSQGEAVVLQHGREEIARIPLRHRERDDGPRSGRWWGRLWNLDVDADGCDELLVVCDQKVRAFRPFSGESAAEAPVWEWSIPAGSDRTTEDEPEISPEGRMADVFDAEIIALLPAAEELPATVAVRHQNRVYGLSAADGSLLWSSAEGSVQAGPQRAPPTMFVLPSGDGPAPHVISTFPDEVTVCRRAIAVASDTLPIPDRAVTSTTALAEDPRLLRPLPWASNLQDVAEIAQLFAWAAMFSVVVIVLPGGLLWRMVKKRRWSLRTMLLLPVVIAIVITVLRTDLPGAPRDWNTVYVKLVYALIILPAVAIAAELIYSVYSGRWRRLACWITASVLFALLAASLTVIVPSQGSIDLGERYAWDGWYLIWFPGAYVTGILVIAERALGTAYRSARQMSGGRPAPDR